MVAEGRVPEHPDSVRLAARVVVAHVGEHLGM